MKLHVIEPGLHSRIVDLGRTGYRGLGVPQGGAADQTSLVLGNALVGNPANTPALEITMLGPRLCTDTSVACVLFGAPFSLRGDQHEETARLRPGVTFTLRPGEELRIGGTEFGLRAYLCVRGGFAAPSILGSRSALAPIQAGHVLECAESSIRGRGLSAWPIGLSRDETLRILHGPQAEWFHVDMLQRQQFKITPNCDRMGLRLQSEPVAPRSKTFPEMVSEPVAVGSVQVTRDGQCIILGVDGQTIGGYPKIAQVVSADHAKLGQLRPGQRVRFENVSLEEAEILYQDQQAELRQWEIRLNATLSVR